MKKIVSGQILTYDEELRILTMECCRKIQHFYLQRSLINHIGKYLAVGRFIQFTISKEPRMYKKHKVYTIDYVIKIMHLRYRKSIVYYDVKNIKRGTRALLNNLKYKMFLDLEMSMHPYKIDKLFKQEIIQVGYVLYDEQDNIVERYNQIIQPSIHKTLTKRTLRFLEITQDQVDEGIEFSTFYHHFKDVISTYEPAVIVWGRNDFLALKDAYKINRLPNIDHKTRYINLLKLHKNFYHLKNDLGLFNALNLYYPHDNEQSHNAYEDALATAKIFQGFRDVVNNIRTIDLQKYK